MGQSKEPIRLRQRKTASGNTTLYLDIYLNGKRSYEYLKLYLIPETNRKDKEKNRQTLQLAAIRAKRVVELQNGEYGFNAAYKLDTNFLDYYRMLCEKRHGKPENKGNWGNWYSCLKHLERFCKPNMTFRDVTPEWIVSFREYLDKTARCRDKRKTITTDEVTKPLSQNSKVSYFNKLRACINQAFEDRIISFSRIFRRSSQDLSVSGLKSAFLPPLTSSSNALSSSGFITGIKRSSSMTR